MNDRPQHDPLKASLKAALCKGQNAIMTDLPEAMQILLAKLKEADKT